MTPTMTAMNPPALTAPAAQPDHPAHGQNWHPGSAHEPAGLLFDDPRHGGRAELDFDLDADVYEAAAEAAPGEGLTFDGFLNAALNSYLDAVGLSFPELRGLAVRAYLARIGRPLDSEGASLILPPEPPGPGRDVETYRDAFGQVAATREALIRWRVRLAGDSTAVIWMTEGSSVICGGDEALAQLYRLFPLDD